MSKPKLLVLGTGGTIAGAARTATGKAYGAGEVAIETLVADVTQLGLDVDLKAQTIGRIGSQDIGWKQWDALHTAITRARKKVTLVGDPEIFARAVGRRIERGSGLAARLQGLI